jgi:DNA-binding transcriptional MocR family regulator
MAGRVLHIGSFSKTISPALRLGFIVVPPELSRRFADLALRLAPAPAAACSALWRNSCGTVTIFAICAA